MRKRRNVHGYRWVQELIDRHGTARRYFRKPGCRRQALPHGCDYHSDEFRTAYNDALEGREVPKTEIGADRTITGTISHLVVRYYESAAFRQLDRKTQRDRRSILERMRVAHGDKPVRLLHRDAIKSMQLKMLDHPHAANKWLKVMRMILNLAMDMGLRTDNPTAGVKLLKTAAGGYKAWSDDDVAAFEAVHPIGTMQRNALVLLLSTACRRGDAIAFGWQHVIRDGTKLRYSQGKNRAHYDTAMVIPIAPKLADVIAALPRDRLTFLVNDQGRPFTGDGFGRWFGAASKAAGLVGLSAHGLRKTAAVRLLAGGLDLKRIAAVTGHRSLSQLEVYLRSAEQEMLASSTAEHLGRTA